MISTKVLIICGPTATGKTRFGLQMAKKFKGEIVSADSRQVYVGMDIVTGKDIPYNLKPITSNLQWRDRKLKYYLIDSAKIWLYDVVNPNEPFNVAFWKECADLVIADIFRRNRLPIVVGGTGLYLKSLTVGQMSQSLSKISILPNPQLRSKLKDRNVAYLFNYLNRIDPARAAVLNISDRANPRRLIRAIEISLYSKFPSPESGEGSRGEVGSGVSYLTLGLTAPREELYRRIDLRVGHRLRHGAEAENQHLIAKYGGGFPSFTASGYRAFQKPDIVARWRGLEHAYLRRQLTWFKRQPDTHWFDINTPNWQISAKQLISNWYNVTSIQHLASKI